MIAAARFVAEIPAPDDVERLTFELFGSLALTGKGHATDGAIVLGLLGYGPGSLDPDAAPDLVRSVTERKALRLPGGRSVTFDPATDIVFLKRQTLPRHSNALRFIASGPSLAFTRTYYSVGGGFIVTDADEDSGAIDVRQVPYPFRTSGELLAMAGAAGLTITEL